MLASRRGLVCVHAEEQVYAALMTMQSDESGEILIFRIEDSEYEDMDDYVTVEDERILEAVYEIVEDEEQLQAVVQGSATDMLSQEVHDDVARLHDKVLLHLCRLAHGIQRAYPSLVGLALESESTVFDHSAVHCLTVAKQIHHLAFELCVVKHAVHFVHFTTAAAGKYCHKNHSAKELHCLFHHFIY